METLIIEISKEAEKLKMSAYDKKRATEHRHYSENIVSDHEIEKICCDITSLFYKANKQGMLSDNYSNELKKHSQLLYDVLLTREIKRRISDSKARFLIFSIDEKLVQIPWELMHNGEGFLSLLYATGRIVRTKQRFHGAKYRSSSSSLKMLMLCDPTSDLNVAYKEGINIRDNLDKYGKKIKTDLKTTEIDKGYVKLNIRDYDIVHYAGHAQYDLDDPSQSGWVLSDGRFTPNDIASLGASAPFPMLIFSNACESGKTEEWKIEEGYENKIYGLANAFLLAGVRHYIGTFWKILDEPSEIFSREFYLNLANGVQVGEAIRLARLKLFKEYGDESIIWASYVLYGDPSISLFSLATYPVERSRSFTRKQILIIFLISSLLTSAGLLSYLIYQNKYNKPFEQPNISWKETKRIVVMPFENLDKNKQAEWIGSGIADIISAKIGSIDQITVVDRATFGQTFRMMQEDDSVTKDNALKIAKTYGSDKVVFGSYQKVNEDLRITAKLLRVSDAELIEVIDVTGKYSKLFELEDSIALKIIEALDVKISKREKEKLKKAYLVKDLNSFEYFVKAITAYDANDNKNAETYCKKALEKDPKFIRAKIVLGLIFQNACLYDEAKKNYIEALSISREKDNRKMIMHACHNLGNVYNLLGDYEKGAELHSEALSIAQSLGDKFQYASILYRGAMSHLTRSDYVKAKEKLFESESLMQQSMNIYGLADIYLGIAIYYIGGIERDINKALQYCDKALNLYNQSGYKYGVANTYATFGSIYQSNGQTDKGIIYLAKSLKIAREIGSKLIERNTTSAMGNYYQQKKEYGNAVKYYSESLRLSKEIGDVTGIKSALFSLGSTWLQQERCDKSLEYFRQYVKEAINNKDRINEAIGLIWTGKSYELLGDYSNAVIEYNKALKIKEYIQNDANNIMNIMQLYLGLGACYAKMNKNNLSHKYYMLGMDETDKCNDDYLSGYYRLTIGVQYDDCGEINNAIISYEAAIKFLKKAKADGKTKECLGAAYFKLGECKRKTNDISKAVNYYNIALEYADDNNDLRRLIKDIKLFIGRDEGSLEVSIENDKSKELYDLSINYSAKKDYPKALKYANEANKIEPYNKDIIYSLCSIYECLGMYKDAINVRAEYVRNLDKKKDIIEIIDQYICLASYNLIIGDIVKAKEYSEKCISLEKTIYDSRRLGGVYAMHSKILEAHGNDLLSEGYATKAIEIGNRHQDSKSLLVAYYVLSMLSAKKNDHERAIEYAKKRYKIDVESGGADLGRSYALLGSAYRDVDLIKSVENLNKSVDVLVGKGKLAELSNVYNRIGSVYEKTGQDNKALEMYQKSLVLSDEFNDKFTSISNCIGLENIYHKMNKYDSSEKYRKKIISLCKELGKEKELGLLYSLWSGRYEHEDPARARKYLILSNELSESKNDKNERTIIMNNMNLGKISFRNGEYKDAIIYFNKAIDYANKSDKNYAAIMGDCYCLMAESQQRSGNYVDAIDNYEKAKGIYARIKEREKYIKGADTAIAAAKYYRMKEMADTALKHHKDGEFPVALDLYREAMTIANDINDENAKEWIDNKIKAINNYGEQLKNKEKTSPVDHLRANALIYIRQGKYDAALANYNKILSIYEGVNSKEGIYLTKLNIGLVNIYKNKLDEANRYFEECEKMFKEISGLERSYYISGAYGLIFEKKGEYDKAKEKYSNMLKMIQNKAVYRRYEIIYYDCLAAISYKKGNYDEALKHYNKALNLGRSAADSIEVSINNLLMGYVYYKKRNFREAENALKMALNIANKLDDKDLICINYLMESRMLQRQDKIKEAYAILEDTIQYINLINKDDLRKAIYINLIILSKANGRLSEGDQYFKELEKISEDRDISEERVDELLGGILEDIDYSRRIWY